MSRLRIACPWAGLALSLVWIAPAHAVPTEPNQLTNQLATAESCQNCHSYGNSEAHADDPFYAPFFGWQGSMMGNSAKDPVFWAGVAIASQDEPGGTVDCVRCHAPRAFLEGRGDAIAMDELQLEDLAGVECELCHRMVEDVAAPAGNARYTIDDVLVGDEVPRRGPWSYEDGDPGQPAHEWINDPFTGGSRLCGTCHDVTTPRERVDDEGVGLGIQFGEQRTYSEWLGSAFSVAGEDFRSCQDCHMPAVADMPGCFDNVNAGLSHPEGGRRHDLVGANRFMLELFRGIYGSAGTDEVPDFFWDTSIDRTDELLATAASLEVEGPSDVDVGAGLEGLSVIVTNNTGHKLPTGYSEGRVMWIEVVASYADEVVWSSGAWNGTEYEEDAQLHTYRAVAEELASGTTLHLLLNDHWIEDTRLPPRGLQQNIETDPVGDRYTPLGDGTWPNADAVAYGFTGRDDVVDATPASADDDVLDVRVRLLYLVNSREYVQFLADANNTNTAGDDVLSLFEAAGFAQPVELASADLAIPITAFGGVADSSSSSSPGNADTSATSASTDPDTGPNESGPGTSEESTVGIVDDEGGGGSCSCRTQAPSGPWLLVVLLGLLRPRRQPKRRPSTNLRHIASKRSMSPS